MKLFGFVFILIIGVLMVLWRAYIVWDVATLFQLEFILKFSYMQILALSGLLSFLTVHLDDPKRDGGYTEIFIKQIYVTVFFGVSWGMFYVYHWLLSK